MNRLPVLVLLLSLFVSTANTSEMAPSPVNIDKSSEDSPEITLSGKLTRENIFRLELEQPLTIFNGVFGKKFETKKIDVDFEECKNFKGNWDGSKVKIAGYLTNVSDKRDEYKDVVFFAREISGQAQALSGPLYRPEEDELRLSGTLRLVKCEKKENAILTLDKKINVAQSGEFLGPKYDVTSLQLLGPDVRQGLKNGKIIAEGTLTYLHGDDTCPGDGVAMEVKKIDGAKDDSGKLLGLREVLVRLNWDLKPEVQDENADYLNESLNAVEQEAEERQIPIIFNNNMKVTYILIDGHRKKEIKDVQMKADFESEFHSFFGPTEAGKYSSGRKETSKGVPNNSEGSLKVWWNNEMGKPMLAENAKQQSDFLLLLKRAWDKDNELVVEYKDAGAKKKKTIGNCEDLLSTDITGTVPGLDREVMSVWRSDCWCMKKFIGLKDSKESFLDLKGDQWISQLSKISLDSDYGPYKQFFKGIDKIERHLEPKSSEIFVETKTTRYGIRVEGKGDYDGDGIEDFLLLVKSSALDGHGTTALGFVITRLGDGQDFKVLDWFKKD